MKIKEVKELALFLYDLKVICKKHKIDYRSFVEINLTNVQEQEDLVKRNES